jgi:hypothetical protein
MEDGDSAREESADKEHGGYNMLVDGGTYPEYNNSGTLEGNSGVG